MLFSWTTGQENFKDQSSKIVAWHSSIGSGARRHPRTGCVEYKDELLSKAIARNQEVKKSGYTSKVKSAVLSGDTKLGFWYKNTNCFSEGTLLKFMFEKHNTYSSNNFDRSIRFFIYLKLRENAAHTKIEFPLSSHPNARYSCATIVGNFDIITSNRLDRENIFVMPKDKIFFSEDLTSNYLNIEELAPAKESKQLTKSKKVLVNNTIQNIQVSSSTRRLRLNKD